MTWKLLPINNFTNCLFLDNVDTDLPENLSLGYRYRWQYPADNHTRGGCRCSPSRWTHWRGPGQWPGPGPSGGALSPWCMSWSSHHQYRYHHHIHHSSSWEHHHCNYCNTTVLLFEGITPKIFHFLPPGPLHTTTTDYCCCVPPFLVPTDCGHYSSASGAVLGQLLCRAGPPRHTRQPQHLPAVLSPTVSLSWISKILGNDGFRIFTWNNAYDSLRNL